MVLSQDQAKRNAGKAVLVDYVRSGMKLGLGSGTTSHFFVRELGQAVREGLEVTCTTTSASTSAVATEVGIKIHDLDELKQLDMTVDGPDEIDSQLQMIKGGGACLLWEKIVAHASKQVVIVCDETKLVDHLGAFPLPVEIVRFSWQTTIAMLAEHFRNQDLTQVSLNRRVRDKKIVITDSGNYIIDCNCGFLPDPKKIASDLNDIPGVVEHGLFLQEADVAVMGKFDGSIAVLTRAADK